MKMKQRTTAPIVNGTAACAFEIFLIDDGEPIEYQDMIDQQFLTSMTW